MAKHKQAFANNDNNLKVRFTSVDVNGEIRRQSVFCMEISAHNSIKEVNLRQHLVSTRVKYA